MAFLGGKEVTSLISTASLMFISGFIVEINVGGRLGRRTGAFAAEQGLLTVTWTATIPFCAESERAIVRQRRLVVLVV